MEERTSRIDGATERGSPAPAARVPHPFYLLLRTMELLLRTMELLLRMGEFIVECAAYGAYCNVFLVEGGGEERAFLGGGVEE